VQALILATEVTEVRSDCLVEKPVALPTMMWAEASLFKADRPIRVLAVRCDSLQGHLLLQVLAA